MHLFFKVHATRQREHVKGLYLLLLICHLRDSQQKAEEVASRHIFKHKVQARFVMKRRLEVHQERVLPLADGSQQAPLI
eukprot:scaffold216285_cov16-Tisochrysis_lutea.AAC.2